MVNTMEDYIVIAREMARKNFDSRKEITKKFVEIFKKKKYKRVIIIASGSSYNIANNARCFMQKYLQMEVKVIWPNVFVYYDYNTVNDDDLVLVLTQGGHSTNTIAALSKLKEMKIDAACFTNWPDSPVKEYAKWVISYNSAPGDKFVTKGLVISTLFLMLCALEAALATDRISKEKYDDLVSQFELVLNKKLEEAQIIAIDFYENHRDFCQTFDRLMVVGCGATWGTALEAALKFTETQGCPATAFDLEEIIHGPDYEIYQNHTVLFIDGTTSPVHERMMTIYNSMKLLTNRVMIETSDSTVGGDYVLRFEDDGIEEEIAALYYIVPFQLIVERGCIDTRISSIDRRNIAFKKAVAPKLPGNKF